jgi:hypothetical protein
MLIALALFSSCSLKRNLCLNGVTLWHVHSRSACLPETHRQGKAEFEKKSLSSEKEIVGIIVAAPASPKEQQEKIAGHSTLKSKKFRERKKIFSRYLFSAANKKILPTKPKDTKFKISVSKINALAFISFLMVPLFIASLFTSSIFFILSTFCIGVILATICGFLADGRKGCWMVGIAIGFWVVIVLYMGLLLFVF